jgi:lipopolysaccharide/colanic/teichoic acid biosynthesis glycosyltransferase
LLNQEEGSPQSVYAARRGRVVRFRAGGSNPLLSGARQARGDTVGDGDGTAVALVSSPPVLVPVTQHETPGYVASIAARRGAVEPPSRLGLAAKRAVDLAGSTVGLLLLGPFLVGVGALIALVDGRPVLFRQMRAGRNERPFWIYKFRTMRNGADAERAALRAHNEVVGGASFKMANDPRVTRLGRLLRRTSIDEFPQLLNVLRGEMSLVGPRPHPFDDLAGYQPWHHGRFAVKPGMTGLWQVSSRRDPDFDRWVELDLEYIRTWSPLLDIRIIAWTIPAMLRSDGR